MEKNAKNTKTRRSPVVTNLIVMIALISAIVALNNMNVAKKSPSDKIPDAPTATVTVSKNTAPPNIPAITPKEEAKGEEPKKEEIKIEPLIVPKNEEPKIAKIPFKKKETRKTGRSVQKDKEPRIEDLDGEIDRQKYLEENRKLTFGINAKIIEPKTVDTGTLSDLDDESARQRYLEENKTASKPLANK